ncbi:MAG: sensor histidine kinase [Flavisolibacter sp.]
METELMDPLIIKSRSFKQFERLLMVLVLPIVAIGIILFFKWIATFTVLITLPTYLFFVVVSYAIWLICRRLFFYFKFSDINKNYKFFWISYIPASLAASFTISYFSLYIWFSSDIFFAKPFILSSVLASLTALFLSSVYEVILLYIQHEQEQLQNERLKNKQLLTQISLLNNQVEPHFLSNSLSFLQPMVNENAQANDFVIGLSRLYYNLVELKDHPLISLEREMDLLHQYYQLMQHRFPNSLELQIDYKANHWKQKQIPPFSLQSCFENAIKHNTFSQSVPLLFYIQIHDEKIICNNKKSIVDVLSETTHTGLQSLNERFRLIIHKPIEFIDGNDLFTIILPLNS